MWRNRKKERERGSDAAMHAPELSGLYFAGMRERVQRMEKEDARIQAILLDAVGWETRAMIEDPYARIRQVHKCYRWNSDRWRFNKVEMDGVVWLTWKFCSERCKELYSQQRKDLMYLLISLRNLLSLFYFRFSLVISLFSLLSYLLLSRLIDKNLKK